MNTTFGQVDWGALAGPLALLGALAVVLVVAAYVIGRARGRRGGSRGLAQLEALLRALLRGEFESTVSVGPEDPAAAAAGLASDLARRLRERQDRGERRVAALVDAIESLPGHAALLVDREFTVSMASAGAASILTGAPAELEGRSLQDLLTTDSFRALAALAAERRRRRESFACQLAFARPGGGEATCNAHAAWSQAPADALGLLLEVLHTPDAGEPPVATLERRQAIFDALPDAVLVVRAGAVVEANPEALSWLGPSVVGTPVKNLVAAEDLLVVLERVRHAEDGLPAGAVLCRLVPPTANLPARDIELFAAPVRFAGQGAAALTLRDLGAERRADRRARVHEARLAAVLSAVGDGLLLLAPPTGAGAPWRVGLANQRALELIGVDESRVLGAPEEELRALAAHRFKDPAGFAALFAAAARAPRDEHESTFDLADAPATVDLIVRPVLGAEAELLGRLVVVRDATRRRETERQLVADASALARSRESLTRSCEQLAQVNRDLEHKSAELDRLNRELVEIDRARAQLLADVSHELQTPLVSIRGYTQMILEGRLGRINDEQRRGLEVALRNVDRMVDLINKLLGLARAEAGAPVQPTAVDPAEVAAEVIERHQQAARRRAVQLELQVDEPEARVAAEREGLLQVLDNLVGNAIKFNRDGGRVRVSVQSGQPGFVRLDVSDTGMGIPTEEQGRVFERFYRGRSAAGAPGSGIGLATVKSVVTRHGGTIELESTPGQGSVFRVYWPRFTARETGAAAVG